MPKTHIDHRVPTLAVSLSLLLATLGLAACGGSGSSGASTAASTTSTSATSANAQTGARDPARFTALRACLQKNGITLPQRPPGGGRGPGSNRSPGGLGPGGNRPPGGRGGGLLRGGGGANPLLPKGVTRAQLQSAMRKCGGAGAFGGAARANNPAFRQSLAKFAACMSQNGVKLPAPKTSGGPVFDTKGLNTHSKAFIAAETKCRPLLRGNFTAGRPPGAPGGA